MRALAKLLVITTITLGLMAVRPKSDADFIAELTEKLESYNKRFPHSKLYLDFDQPGYAPGDTAYFRAYLLNEDLTFTKGRQVVHLVLVDGDGNEALRNAISVDNGITETQFVVDREIPPGRYLLVAYTNWMKNFSRDLYFTSPFTVSGEYIFTAIQDGDVNMDLLPEGGALVAGASSRVVVYSQRQKKPVATSGRMVEGNGTEVQAFSTGSHGLFTFEFTPKPQTRYFLESASGSRIEVPVQEEGWALHVAHAKDLIHVKIEYQSSRLRAESLTVVLTSRSKIAYASMVRTNAGETIDVIIPTRTIPEGLAQLALFDSKGNQVGSRVLYVRQGEAMVPNLTLATKSVNTRSPIAFDLDLKDSYGAGRQADLLINSYHQSLFVNAAPDLRSQLLIGLDLPDARPLLERIDPFTDEGFQVLDDFLITQKWKRFSWNEILDLKKREAEYPVINSLHFTGEAVFRESGKAVPDSTMILFLLQNEIFGYEVYAVDGKFEWPVFFNFYGNDNIMYSMEHKGKRLQNTMIKLAVDSLTGFRAEPTVTTRQKDPYYAFSTLTDVVNNSFSYSWSAPELKKAIANPNANFEDELYGADATIRVDEYVVFPTMEDLFREVVRFVQHRKIGGKPTLRVLSSDSNNPIMGEPLYVIDGIATRNTDFVLKMKPGEIATIKVINDVKKLKTMGHITRNGVVFFQTKVADMASRIPNEDILVLRGLNKPINFPVNKLSPTASLRIPNLKSSLYWRADFERNERGLISDEFYSSDNTGTLTVRVSGLAEGGIPFDHRQTVEVNFVQAQK